MTISVMDEPLKKEPLHRRLRYRSREIVWALLVTLLALGAIAISLIGS